MDRIRFEWLDQLPPGMRKWLPRLFLGAVIYSLVGFLLLPALIKWQMVRQLPAITKRDVAVRQVLVNPWVFSLTVRGLALTEPDGRIFASWDEFYVNFQLSSVVRGAWTFQEIRLVKPFGDVILFKDGRLNFANMLEAKSQTPASAEKPGAIPKVQIFHLQITNGAVAFEDRTLRTPFRTQYRPIEIDLNDFKTVPGSKNPYSFRAESDAGRSLAWDGDLVLQPLSSRGTLAITGVKLPRYQPYLEEFTRARVTSGEIDVRFSYGFSADAKGTDLIVSNLTMRAETMRLQDPDTGEDIATVGGVLLQRTSLNLRNRSVLIGAAKANQITLLARLRKDGQLNWLGLLEKPSASAPVKAAPATAGAPVPPWTLFVDEFAVEKAQLIFEDLTRRTPFKTELTLVDCNLSNFATKPGWNAIYSFHVLSEVAEDVSGTGRFSVDPLRSTGVIRLAGLDLKKYMPYLDGVFLGGITSGKVQLQAPYHFAQATNALVAGVSNLTLRVTGLELSRPGATQSVVRVGDFAVEGVEASLREKRIRIPQARANGGFVFAERRKDGAISLLDFLPVRTNQAPPIQPATNPLSASKDFPAWSVILDEFILDNYSVKLEDQQPLRPVAFRADQLRFSLKGFNTASNVPIETAFSVRLNEACLVAASGKVRTTPLAADLAVGTTNLDLRVLQPYLEPFLRLGISSATLSLGGRLRFQTEDAREPQLVFQGGLRLTNVLTMDQVRFKEFVKWEDLAVEGINLALQPDQLKIDEVKWRGLHGDVLIGADKRPNFALILKSEEASMNQPAKAPSATNAVPVGARALFPMQLGVLTLANASVQVADESIQPAAHVGLQEITGSIKKLSTGSNDTAEVDLMAKVDGEAPFAIKGRLNPLAQKLFLDLQITNRSTQLSAFSPYMEKYAGHPLNRGRLTLGLNYHIDGKALKAENRIQIDQLTLGARNKSPDATSLPVKLAVALLKDRNGRIELNIPVEGKLDDPKFKVGPIILDVVLNLLAKAATSPFKLLGALVGGGEEMSFVEFAPGSTNLAETELQKLAKLSKALNDRPALNLEIEGAVDRARDRKILAAQKWSEEMRVRRLRELASLTNAPQATDSFILETNDYRRLLRIAFVEKFGTNISDLLGTNAAPVQSSNIVGSAAASQTNKPLASPSSAPESKEAAVPKKKDGLIGRLGSNAGTETSSPKGRQDRRQTPSAGLKSEQPVAKTVPAAEQKDAQPEQKKTPALDQKGGLFDQLTGKSKVKPPKKGEPNLAPVPRLTRSDALVLVQTPDEVMEAMLIERVEVSDQDLRRLMTDRARWVQTYLIKTGQVAAERLFLDAPNKALDAKYKDQSRVVLTLN